MSRKLLGAGLLLAVLAGCTDPVGRPCSSDDQCGEGGLCDTSVGYCYASGTEPEIPNACNPACPDYEVCTRSGCRARFERLTIQAPVDDAVLDAGTVQVVAVLEVKDTYKDTTRFPATLDFTAEPPGGGAPGSFTNQSSDDAGTYRMSWTPPAVEARYTLRVAHPAADAGLSDSVSVTVDGVPPVFAVTVPPYDAGVPDGGTTYGDSFAPDHWARDQQVPVEVRTNETNLDPASVRVALRGTDGIARPAVPVTPVTTGCDAGFCGVAVLNLWEPTFDAFRGAMTLEVQGQDRAGNPGTVTPSTPQVNVTRAKWAFSVPAGAIRASPAVGEQGNIYLGTVANTIEGRVLVLKPDGTKQWDVSVGAVASLAVGASDGGVESIYVAANLEVDKAVLYALSSAGGATRVRCPSGTNVHDGQVRSAMAITLSGTAQSQFETGVAIVNDDVNTQLYLVRPEAPSSTQCVPSNPAFVPPETNPDSALIASGSTIFYPTGSTSIVGYTLFNSTVDWTAAIGTHAINGLALTGQTLVGGGSGASASQGGLYRVTLPVSGPAGTAELLPGTSGGRVWNPIIGPGGTNVFYGQDTASAQGDLKKYDLPGQNVTNPVTNVGVLKYASALGADGVLYTASSTSTVVTARSATDLSQRWAVMLSAASSASVALDCARNASGAPVSGRPGTLYVPAGGTLHALIVDSPGLSKDAAAWPKFQHDARNTGNPATVVTNCP